MVILGPPDPASADEPVTSANLDRLAPSPDAVAALMELFRSEGFEIGPFVGISFSISGPPHCFRSVFGPRLPSGRQDDLELDVGSVPPGLRRHLRAVSFTAPPDYGPLAP